jgi:hypothetical protein
MTLREQFKGQLSALEAECPDTHLTVVRRWEDIIDAHDVSDDEEAWFEDDLLMAMDDVGLEVRDE